MHLQRLRANPRPQSQVRGAPRDVAAPPHRRSRGAARAGRHRRPSAPQERGRGTARDRCVCPVHAGQCRRRGHRTGGARHAAAGRDVRAPRGGGDVGPRSRTALAGGRGPQARARHAGEGVADVLRIHHRAAPARLGVRDGRWPAALMAGRGHGGFARRQPGQSAQRGCLEPLRARRRRGRPRGDPRLAPIRLHDRPRDPHEPIRAPANARDDRVRADRHRDDDSLSICGARHGEGARDRGRPRARVPGHLRGQDAEARRSARRGDRCSARRAGRGARAAGTHGGWRPRGPRPGPPGRSGRLAVVSAGFPVESWADSRIAAVALHAAVVSSALVPNRPHLRTREAAAT